MTSEYVPGLALTRVIRDPVCEHRAADGRYCSRLAVSVDLVQGMSSDVAGAYRSRCPDHRPADAPRFCLACHRPNDGRDEWRCGPCTDSIRRPLRDESIDL